MARREPILDVIRVVALMVVLIAPISGSLAQPLILLAGGVTVGVSGSLVAARLVEKAPHYRAVLGRRLLRLLGPYWVFMVIMVPLLGWEAHRADGLERLALGDLWRWVLPLAVPPALPEWSPWVPPLTLISAQMVLISGAAGLFWLLRRWPVALGACVLAVLTAQLLGVVEVGGTIGTSLLTVTALVPCLLIGFAHRLGWLRRIPLGAILLMVLALAAAVARGARSWGPGDADALATLGVAVVTWCLVLVSLWSSSAAPAVPRWVAAPAERIAGRFATLLLWSGVAVGLGQWLVDRLPGALWWPGAHAVATVAWFVVIVLGTGWIEDLFAGRTIRMGFPRQRWEPPLPVVPHSRRGAVTVVGTLALTGVVAIAGQAWAVNPEVVSHGTAGCVPESRPAVRTQPADLSHPRLRTIARMLISSAENSSLDWEAHYAYIEYNVEGNDEENRGYTAGIVGFTSRTGDLLLVVRRYAAVAPDATLAAFAPALDEVNGTAATDGLGPEFERAWQAADSDERFRTIQREVADELYFDPSLQLAQSDGVGVLGQFIYLDAAVMHGFGTVDNTIDHIRAATLLRATPPALGGDERAWLEVFLDERENAMRAEAGHADTTRVNGMQRVFLAEGNLGLAPPLRWSVYGDRYEIPRSAVSGCR